MRVRAASTSDARMNAPSPEPSSGSTACSGWGMSPMTFRSAFQDACDIGEGAVRVRVRLVAQDDLVVRLELGEKLGRSEPAAVAVLHRNREELAFRAARRERCLELLDPDGNVTADEAQRRVGTEDAWQKAGLAQDLKPVADPEDGSSLGGELGDGAHRGREPRHRAGAQVVAVREPAGEDDGVQFRELVVAVPDELRVRSERRESPGRVTVVVRAGEDDDADPRAKLAHAAPFPREIS